MVRKDGKMERWKDGKKERSGRKEIPVGWDRQKTSAKQKRWGDGWMVRMARKD